MIPCQVRTAFAAVALIVAISAGAGAPAGAVTVQRVVSPGGIEAWLVEERAIPFLTIRFAFRGGAKLDPPGKAGLAQLVSGLLDEGAGERDSLAFQTQLEELAIELWFEAQRDVFSGSLKTLSEHREQAADLLAAALTTPRFDTDAIERVRQQNLNALARITRDPNRLARRLWAAAAFADHPYGRPKEGTAESMSALAVEDLRRFVAERLARDVLVIGVSGDIGAADLGPLLDRAFAALPAEAAPAAVPETMPGARGAVVVERMAVPQSVAVFGHGGVKRDDPDYYAAYVMNHVLGGGGFSSRLTEEVREKRGLAYGVYSYLIPLVRSAVFAGGVATENARVAESLELIRAELTRLRDGGVTRTELADAKTYITGSFPLRLDSNREVAGRLMGMQLADLGIDYLDRRNRLIEAVTLDDIRRVARRMIAPEALTVVVVGDPQGVTPTGLD